MKVGIIGFGNMGSAIAERIKSKYTVAVFDKDKSRTNNLEKIEVVQEVVALVQESEAIILAVKPQDFNILFTEIKNYTSEKLIISIAAGINTGRIEKDFIHARVIRAMPNIALKIGESVTCLSKGKYARNEDLSFAIELFNYLGVTRIIDENLMNAATAISGSGPGYIFYSLEANFPGAFNISEEVGEDIIKKLESAAESVGFNASDASFLATNTVKSSFRLLEISGVSPGELRNQVTSKGGTTEAALKILGSGGSWPDAAHAALKRAEELSCSIDKK